jgi:hypothetical protein
LFYVDVKLVRYIKGRTQDEVIVAESAEQDIWDCVGGNNWRMQKIAI